MAEKEINGNFKNLVMEFENALPYEVCDNIVDFFEEHKSWQKPGIVADDKYKPKVKKSMDIQLMANPVVKMLEKELTTMTICIYKAFYKYWLKNYAFWGPHFKDVPKEFHQNEFNLYINSYSIFDFIMKRYDVEDEGKYEWHNDLGSHQWSSWSRRHGILIYLNDVKEGGETEFFHTGQKITPKKGKIAFFPPFHTHQHKGHIPKSNNKYIISSWFAKDLQSSNPEIYEKFVEYEKKALGDNKSRKSLINTQYEEASQKINYKLSSLKLNEK
tara:strand:+ start:279 stop:1094 length:816 start_codon:yes stop_codon:yes gene_type:complete